MRLTWVRHWPLRTDWTLLDCIREEYYLYVLDDNMTADEKKKAAPPKD